MSEEDLKEVYSARDLPEATMIAAMLESHGIRCRISNTSLQMAMGDLPWHLVTPRILVRRADIDVTRQLLEEWRRQPDNDAQTHPEWTCPRCDEINGPAFDLCWNCSWERDRAVDPSERQST